MIYYFISIIFAVFSFSSLLTAQTNLPIGTKNKFYCKVSSPGIAQIFRSRPFAELSLTQRIRAWERKRNNLRLKKPFHSTNRRLSRARLREINRMIADAKVCRSQNNPSAACGIFVDSHNNSNFLTPFIISGSACFGSNSPVVKLDMYNSRDEYQGSCSGTVVHPRVVISAAHCVEYRVARVEIRNIMGQLLANSTQLFSQPRYNGLADFDLAVIKTAENMNTAVMPLHKVNDLVPSETSAIAGYGIDEKHSAGQLKAGFFSILGFSNNDIRARFLPGSGSNTCYGDSGGPAAVFRDGHWRLVGATSNGDNRTCGINGKPDLSRWVNITSPANMSWLLEVASELN